MSDVRIPSGMACIERIIELETENARLKEINAELINAQGRLLADYQQQFREAQDENARLRAAYDKD